MSRILLRVIAVFATFVAVSSWSKASPIRSMTMMASKYLGTKPVFVAGGSTGTGLEIVRQLAALGTPVQALVRSKEKADLLSTIPGVKVFLGCATNEEDVQKAMEGSVAAITTLGGAILDKDGKRVEGKRVDYSGNSNVVEQAGILGVERIILVTSIGCGKTKDAVSPSVYKALEYILVQKDKAERDLRTYTNLDWTIIRPGGLKDDAPTGTAILTEDVMGSGVINRSDLASIVIQVLGAGASCTRKEFSCFDPTQGSSKEVKPYEIK